MPKLPIVSSKEIVRVLQKAGFEYAPKHLVDEVLEIEKRIHSYPLDKKEDYNFDFYNNELPRRKHRGIERDPLSLYPFPPFRGQGKSRSYDLFLPPLRGKVSQCDGRGLLPRRKHRGILLIKYKRTEIAFLEVISVENPHTSRSCCQ